MTESPTTAPDLLSAAHHAKVAYEYLRQFINRHQNHPAVSDHVERLKQQKQALLTIAQGINSYSRSLLDHELPLTRPPKR